MFRRKITVKQVWRAVERGDITVSQLQAVIDHTLSPQPPSPPMVPPMSKPPTLQGR